MNYPPRLEYYGDMEKAATLKGRALSFYQYVCDAMGEVLSIQREQRDGDTVIQAKVTSSAYGDKQGVVKIYVPMGNDEDMPNVFCASFLSGTDTGTQVYKKPTPPETKGRLKVGYAEPEFYISDGSTLQNKYWINKASTDSIGWRYKGNILSIQGKKHTFTGVNNTHVHCAALLKNNQLVTIESKVTYPYLFTINKYEYTFLDIPDADGNTLEVVKKISHETSFMGLVADTDFNFSILGFLTNSTGVLYKYNKIRHRKYADDYLTHADDVIILPANSTDGSNAINRALFNFHKDTLSFVKTIISTSTSESDYTSTIISTATTTHISSCGYWNAKLSLIEDINPISTVYHSIDYGSDDLGGYVVNSKSSEYSYFNKESHTAIIINSSFVSNEKWFPDAPAGESTHTIDVVLITHGAHFNLYTDSVTYIGYPFTAIPISYNNDNHVFDGRTEIITYRMTGHADNYLILNKSKVLNFKDSRFDRLSVTSLPKAKKL